MLHIIIPPVAVAAKASGPNPPTIAKSIKLIKTRLSWLKISGNAKNSTFLNIPTLLGYIIDLFKTLKNNLYVFVE